VSEFAGELLVLQEYFSHDPDYWVSSGLVDSTMSWDTLFEAACSACNPKTSLSSQAVAARLFDAHSTRALPFLISVVTFLIYSHLISDMCKSFKTCSLFVIGIPIRVKVGLEFSILFSFSRYIFSLFLFSLLFLFIYIYLCCDNFLLYVTREFPISISHVITLITSKYSVISQKIHPSLIILSPYVSIRLDFFSPPL